MNINHHPLSRALTVALSLACLPLLFRADPALAQNGDCSDRAVCGDVSPLIPMQSAEAVHMGLIWRRDSETPKVLFHARFPQYIPNDVADPDVVDAAIAADALDNGVNDFNASLRDVLHPSFQDGSDPQADSFHRLVYGGFRLRQGLSQSVPTRIVANRMMERQLLFDISHPDAFANTGKFHTSELDEDDFALNRGAFTEVGFSRGMFYNTYCNARVTLADGRVYVFGGHDMQSQNGLRKVNIFDPETESWVERALPCHRGGWADDPFGAQLFALDPEATDYLGCNQLDVDQTQPHEPSDMKYQRWYPSAAALPDGTVLVIAGTDQDASVGPDPEAAEKGIQGIVQSDEAFSATRVTQVVPEVYDPRTDSTIALENARKTFPLYPQVEVVQTGPRPDDWSVCTMGGLENVQNPTTPTPTVAGGRIAPQHEEDEPGGGDQFFGPFSKQTWCLDVVAALADPQRDEPAENHWTLLAEAEINRHYCCPTASLTRTDRGGHTQSHRWFMISGRDDDGAVVATIEELDFTEGTPQWRHAGDLLHPSLFSKAVVLPDGKVLIGHGLFRDGTTFEERNGLQFQLYDPETGETRGLASTTVSRGLHGTATLLPDATVFFAGENREALIQTDDPSYPRGGFAQGDPDQGVPNGQIFRPPYLFNTDGSLAERPVIAAAPERIQYRKRFTVEVDGAPGRIDKVVLIRSDNNTHSFTGGERFLDLAFEVIEPRRSPAGLRVHTPLLPAQAVPGIYMLFVVDNQGVPSMAKRVVLDPLEPGSQSRS
jgi:hypothetical protein